MKNVLLQQVALIKSEIQEDLKDAPDERNYPQVHANNGQSTLEAQHAVLLTPKEMDSIFERRKASAPEQVWKAMECDVQINTSCCTCKSRMPGGKIYIIANGLYIPRHQKFAVSRQFYICADSCYFAVKLFARNEHGGTPTSEHPARFPAVI